jgi:hypothetical protein
MVATHGIKESIWLYKLCLGIGFEYTYMKINFDSQRQILLAKNEDYHSRMKHIDVQYHFLRDMVERKKVFVEEGIHFGKYKILFDQVCECCEFLLV